MNTKEQISTILSKSLIKMGVDFEGDILIDIPKNNENGDFSTNIAMQLSKKMNKNPVDIAKLIIENIEANNIIDELKIAGPGFINFFINKNYILKGINYILKEKDNYGRNNTGSSKRVNVEYVSANPTGILHLGTARGAAYGDNICRILDFTGYDVTREYYVNDGGNQINNLGLSIKIRYENMCGMESEMPKDGYFGKEIIEIATNIYNEYKDAMLNKDIEYFKEKGIKFLLNRIESDLKDFRVSFDVWTSEVDIRKSGKIEESLKILNDLGNIYELDNAKWLRTTKYGDDKDRVIVKSNGDYTYVVPDIAYHLDKISRGYDRIIDVLGADHHGYISRLKASIEALGYDKDKINIQMLQMVKLIRDGQEIKMSKRTGESVSIKELVEEVGADAARYFFAMRSLDTQMDFDITLATKKSNENPVYYVEYAHARICSVLNAVETRMEVEEYETITSKYAYNLINKVYEFKDIVNMSSQKLMPHFITNYLYDLANLFHTFYSHEKIISDDIKYTSERLNLIESVKITIKNALNLIGVEALEKM